MEKTEFEIRESVKEHLDVLRLDRGYQCLIRGGVLHRKQDGRYRLKIGQVDLHLDDDALPIDFESAYRLLGLDKRDALEAERAFWTASTDSLTKSLEAEKVKNANGGEFKDMLQQVLNHSNRPEMDDAQFRMFARENINHLLYGNKEGKKDEN